MLKLSIPDVHGIADPVVDNVQSLWRRVPNPGALVGGTNPWRTVGIACGAAGVGLAAGMAIVYFADSARGSARRKRARRQLTTGVKRARGMMLQVVHHDGATNGVAHTEKAPRTKAAAAH